MPLAYGSSSQPWGQGTALPKAAGSGTAPAQGAAAPRAGSRAARSLRVCHLGEQKEGAGSWVVTGTSCGRAGGAAPR